MTAQEAPLGRYGEGAAGALVDVRLLNLPVRLLSASCARLDELRREFALPALYAVPLPAALPTSLLEPLRVLGVAYGGHAQLVRRCCERAACRRHGILHRGLG